MPTEEEKRIARDYNIGYTLSQYEPKLLEKIIAGNKTNEFVKTMAIAKDHHEFNVGIPKKEFNRQYKNGYQNARALAQNEPDLLDRLIASNDKNGDFRKGLEAGKKEYQIRDTMQRMKAERDQAQQLDLSKDKGLEM